jgi:hypothetical protein
VTVAGDGLCFLRCAQRAGITRCQPEEARADLLAEMLAIGQRAQVRGRGGGGSGGGGSSRRRRGADEQAAGSGGAGARRVRWADEQTAGRGGAGEPVPYEAELVGSLAFCPCIGAEGAAAVPRGAAGSAAVLNDALRRHCGCAWPSGALTEAELGSALVAHAVSMRQAPRAHLSGIDLMVFTYVYDVHLTIAAVEASPSRVCSAANNIGVFGKYSSAAGVAGAPSVHNAVEARRRMHLLYQETEDGEGAVVGHYDLLVPLPLGGCGGSVRARAVAASAAAATAAAAASAGLGA